MTVRAIVMALILAAMSGAGHAEPVDNSARQPGRDGSPTPGRASFFEGVWTGTWPTKSDVTITIGGKSEDGSFPTKYSWGFGKYRDGAPITPGTVTGKGREQGNEFVFEWKDKQGIKVTITLKKSKENVVDARIEREGTPQKAGYRPFIETYLTRQP